MTRQRRYRSTAIKLLLAAAFVGVIAAASIVLSSMGGLKTLVTHEQRLRQWIDSHTALAFVLGLAIYATISFIPGLSGKAIAIGWLYGFWTGVLLVEVSLVMTAMASFFISRSVLRELIRSRYAVYLHRLDENLLQRAGLYAVTLRLAHAPYSLLNYVLGATSIRWQTFLWTTAVGLLPGNMAFVFAGVRLPTLAELVEHGAWQLLDPWLLAALGASAVSAPIASTLFDWWKQRASSADGPVRASDA